MPTNAGGNNTQNKSMFGQQQSLFNLDNTKSVTDKDNAGFDFHQGFSKGGNWDLANDIN